MGLNFNYNSKRAREARLARRFTKLVRISLLFVIPIFLVFGILLLFLHQPIGWLDIGVAALGGVAYAWWKIHLSVLEPLRGENVDDILEASVLGSLPPSPSPQDIGKAILGVKGGGFFAARFGIGSTFLSELTSTDPATATTVWQSALTIKNQIGSKNVSAAILVGALIQTHPPMQQVLNSLHLEPQDVIEGARWYHHIQNLIYQHNKPKRTGGIARDLAFGYTPLLKRFGFNISDHISRGGLLTIELEAHANALDQLISTFSSGGKQNIALVGPSGVGKTTIVHVFAERLLDAKSTISRNLKFRQVLALDPAALISAAPGRGQLEGLVNNLMVEAYKAKNIILFLDDAHLFFEEGVGSVDLSNILLPALEAGGLRVVLAMDEQKWLQISARKPGLANALNRVVVAPASPQETIRVMQDQLIELEFKRKVTFTYQALQEAYRLSERYIHELAQPGRAFKLLESAAGYSDRGLVTAQSIQNTIEQTLDIKVGVASGQDERQKLLDLEQKIHERMINQSQAVRAVSDALRRARAGVRNENRPIGTFLFLGPTGVGKTELAKALAATYFNGEDRLLRIDMNEYVKPDDVSRLIADGADDPHSLTAQVMKQPFAVILLDEIEKAHPNVLTTLLQLLDEGILRDIKNREISFRDAIVIATSNAGADTIRKHIQAGEELSQFEDAFVDELIESQQFRPEFLNRFDEIVLFRPLNKDELLQIVDLILAGVNKNLSLQKISVKVEDDAKRILVDKGYDPRLGARPLRRMVQRTVENLVARTMLGGSVAPGSVITISRDDIDNSSGETKTPTSPLLPPNP